MACSAGAALATYPVIAAKIFAVFFRERGVQKFADEKRWDMVRRRVNGGLGNFQLFLACVNKLVAQLDAVTAAKPREAQR